MAIGTPISMSSFNAKLKQWYIDRKNLYVMDSYQLPLFNAITKRTDASGQGDGSNTGWNVAVGAGSVVGGGGTYSNSWSNASSGKDVVFKGVWKDRFGHAFIDDKVIRASKAAAGNGGAIIPVLEDKISQVRDQFLLGTEYQLFRSEGGAIGTLSSFTLDAGGFITGTLSTNTKLTGLQRIRPDMVLNMGPNFDGTSLRGTSGQYTVKKVLDGAGQVVVTGSNGAVTPGSTDYLFIDGDATKALCGLQDWCPKTDALAETTFKTVDRTVDIRALGGIRLDATGLSMTEALIQGGDTAARYSANPTVYFVHPSNLSALKQELHGQVRYEELGKVGGPAVPGGTKGMSATGARKFGMKAIALDGSSKPCLIVPSWAAHQDVTYGVELESFIFHSMGAWPSLRDLDGIGQMIRLTDGVNNSYVHELVGYAEAMSSAPGHIVCVIHSTAA